MMETRHARLERTRSGLIEVHFKPAIKLDSTGLQELHEAKRQLCGTEQPDMLAVFPPEIEFDMSVLLSGHRPVSAPQGLVRRLALAASSAFNRDLAEIYFRYHPREHDTAIFVDEAEARAWLAGQVPVPSLS